MERVIYRAPRMLMIDGHYVADNASIIEGVTLGFQSSVWYGAVLRGDDAEIRIGEETNIQDNCVLHPDPGEPLVSSPSTMNPAGAGGAGDAVARDSDVGGGGDVADMVRRGVIDLETMEMVNPLAEPAPAQAEYDNVHPFRNGREW